MRPNGGRLKALLGVASVALMIGFVTYLPALLPQKTDSFPSLSTTVGRSPSEVVRWLRDPHSSKIDFDQLSLVEKTVDPHGVSFFLETEVLGEKLRFKVNLVEIEQNARERFDLLGYLVDEKGKESFFRSVLSEDLARSRFSMKIFQTDYSSTELSLLYRQVYDMGLR